MTMIPPPNGRECGYDPEVVFPGGTSALVARNNNDWASYEGYFALDRWRAQSRDEAWIMEIKELMATQMSLPRLKFLRMCIEGTILSSLCMKEVDPYGDRVERFRKRINPFTVSGGNEDRVVCTYVDGVAARRGLPLAPTFNQGIADKHRLGL